MTMNNTDPDFLRALASDLVLGPGDKWRDAPNRLNAIADRLARQPMPSVAHPDRRPTIVCLCGSTRFYEEFTRANYEETMAGRIVLSVGFFMHRIGDIHGQAIGCTAEQKVALDQLHLRKIDLADEVLVLNMNGYIGASTARELAYAIATNKRLRFLDEAAGRKYMETQRQALGAMVATFVTGETPELP